MHGPYVVLPDMIVSRVTSQWLQHISERRATLVRLIKMPRSTWVAAWRSGIAALGVYTNEKLLYVDPQL